MTVIIQSPLLESFIVLIIKFCNLLLLRFPYIRYKDFAYGPLMTVIQLFYFHLTGNGTATL